MAEINAKDVMKLRQETGLSMMECKKALVEAGGDAEQAKDALRIKLKGKMDTRTDRAAGEGRVEIAIDGDRAAIVEIRAETDFTAKNEKFVNAAQKCAKLGLDQPAGEFGVTEEMTAAIDDLRITSGENCSFARGCKFEGGTIGSYQHHDGKTAAIVQVEGDVKEETLRHVCIHIVSADPRPIGISAEDLPKEQVEKERQFRLKQAMESGKPQEIAEKMVEGGMRKFYQEVALLEQPFVMDPNKKIKELLGEGVTVKAFLRWQVGEEVGTAQPAAAS